MMKHLLIVSLMLFLTAAPMDSFADADEKNMDNMIDLYKKVTPFLGRGPVLADEEDYKGQLKVVSSKYGKKVAKRALKVSATCYGNAVKHKKLEDDQHPEADKFLKKAQRSCYSKLTESVPGSEIDSTCTNQCVMYHGAGSNCAFMCIDAS